MSSRNPIEVKINDVFTKLSYEPVLDSDSSIKVRFKFIFNLLNFFYFFFLNRHGLVHITDV